MAIFDAFAAPFPTSFLSGDAGQKVTVLNAAALRIQRVLFDLPIYCGR